MARARKKRAPRQPSKLATTLVRTRPTGRSRKRLSPARLATKLTEIRLALGLSQGQIALHLGVKDRASISGYERGEREPPLPVLLAYARVAKLPMETLVDDELDLP